MSGPIVAIGGAEFSMRPENEALHAYILDLAPRPRPRVCLLPTASGDPREQIRSFHAAMDRQRCVASSISLFRLAEGDVDLERDLLAQDVVYVAGGNMINLIALWREHGVDQILRTAHQRGVLLCGYSAGSMCWFESGVSTGAGRPAPTPGLGLLSGSHCVHYHQDPPRRSAYRQLVASGAIPGGLALDDHAAALFRDGELVEAVRSNDSSRAIAVGADVGTAKETPILIRSIRADRGPSDSGLEEMRAIRRMRAPGGGPFRLGG
jgi:peptidase E